jgi:hypothetical protein
MPIDQTQKPQFYEGQYISADDLTGILQFSSVLQARHAIGAHTWGLAMGFDLLEKPVGSSASPVNVFLQPGYAWDGFGRPIVALAPYQIPPERFAAYTYNAAIDEPNGRLVEIWIGYSEIAFQPPASGFAQCNGTQNSRVQETFEIYVGQRDTAVLQHDPVVLAGYTGDAQTILQKLNPAAPAIYDDSIPQQTLPTAPDAMWLLPVGYVRWKPNIDPTKAGAFMATDATDRLKAQAFRIYIGVVAGAVEAAAGVIRLKDRVNDFTPTQSSDLVWVEGDLRLQGRASFVQPDGTDGGVPFILRRNEANAMGGRDLQLVIGESAAGNNHLSIGPLNGAGAFQEKVTVEDKGYVGIGTTSPQDLLHVAGGNVQWANGSQLSADQGGSLELGGSVTQAGAGSPYIDFHFGPGPGPQDFNVRLTNDADGQLTIAGVKNPTVLQVKGRIGVNTNTPAELLDVRGNIKLNSDGGLYAPGGVENLRMVRGSVDPNGNTTAGMGFTVQQIAGGLYDVIFDQPFSSMPSASVTQIFPDPNFNPHGSSRDNAVINGISTSKIRVLTGDDNGSASDRHFSFIVMGPR